MPTIIELPHVGESVTEGVISKWLKEPGDHVDKFEPLVEVMTDKVNMEVPSPHAGTLVRTLAAEGDTVPMGGPICEMDLDGGAGAGSGQPERTAVPTTPSPSAPEGGGEGKRRQPHAPPRSFEFLEGVRDQRHFAVELAHIQLLDRGPAAVHQQ